jgi:hypothetical protein
MAAAGENILLRASRIGKGAGAVRVPFFGLPRFPQQYRRHRCGGVIFGVIFYSWWQLSSWPWSLSTLQRAARDARAAGRVRDALGSGCGDPSRSDIPPLTIDDGGAAASRYAAKPQPSPAGARRWCG